MAAAAEWYEPAAVDVERLRWLRQTREEVLEPEQPIVDPHHHLWDARGPFAGVMRTVAGEEGLGPVTGGAHLAEGRPGGVADPVALGWQQRYLLDDLVDDVLHGGHRVIGTVYVDAGTMYRRDGPLELRCIGETEYVNGVAAAGASGVYGDCALCAGIVGSADLLLGAEKLEPILRAHIAASPRFRGIRVLGYDYPTVVADPRFAEAMALFEQHGLTFDVGTQTDRVAEVVALANAFPNVTFVLNHCGGTPGPANFSTPGVEAKWRAGIAAVGERCPNVYAKVGGIQMTANGFGLSSDERSVPIGSAELAELTTAIYAHVIQCFGV